MENELQHHGIKGQRWGVRRFQNPDGTWTSAGKKRYGDDSEPRSEKTERTNSDKGKKIAVGVATGATVLAGAVLAAYLIKNHGDKSISDITEVAEMGKTALEKVLETPQRAESPVSKPEVIAETVEKIAVKTTTIATTPVSQIQVPRTTVQRAVSQTPPSYDFKTLMQQNDEFLKKMYGEIA